MGTSNSYGGPGGGTPLIPSWLGPDAGISPDDGAAPLPNPNGPLPVPPAPERPAVPPVGASDRFSAPRGNFSRFASSGGSDRASLGRAVSRYVSTSTGGAKQAAQRMGASRRTATGLLNFLGTAVSSGAREALRTLRLEGLAGRPIDEIFLALTDYICPDGGTVDEGIAREAFIETIADLAEAGVTDLDSLTADQMQTIFEMYATNAIAARLCNDIGANAINLPSDARAAMSLQEQLHDFIARGVADALSSARAGLEALTPQNVLGFVTTVYEQAFGILQSLGEAEADRS
ncbi:MAG: Qat anti-phage system associated protein QatB [Bryobacteraceae bacterium]